MQLWVRFVCIFIFVLFISELNSYNSGGFHHPDNYQSPQTSIYAVLPINCVLLKCVWLLSQDLLNDARKRLAEIAKDPARYSSLLEGLVLQVKSTISLSGQYRKSDWFVMFSESSLLNVSGILSTAGTQSDCSLPTAGCRTGSGEVGLTTVLYVVITSFLGAHKLLLLKPLHIFLHLW